MVQRVIQEIKYFTSIKVSHLKLSRKVQQLVRAIFEQSRIWRLNILSEECHPLVNRMKSWVKNERVFESSEKTEFFRRRSICWIVSVLQVTIWTERQQIVCIIVRRVFI